MILRVIPLRFGFQAIDPICFKPGTASNIFRGAFGDILHRTPGNLTGNDAYNRIFAPKAPQEPRQGNRPSGFDDLPRPFVLRAAALDGQRFGAGDRFTLDVNVFDPDLRAIDIFRGAFGQLMKEGLGPGRPRVELIGAEELSGVEVDLSVHAAPIECVRVTFLTPTELKSDGAVLHEPRFDALIKRARDRVTGLIGLYQPSGESGAAFDFRGMGDRATAIRMTTGSFRQNDYERRSARTGQRHSLGGFTGEAVYEGDLAEYLPWLEAAWWTGVGRLTVWGNGWIRTEVTAAGGAPRRSGI